MKKIMSIILVFVMMLSLVACGKSHNTQVSGSEDFHGEGQIQGEIKSDDEIAALQEEERAGTTDAQQSTTEARTENNQQSDDSDTTPATSEIDVQNYWEGDDNFDLIGYLTDNGYKGFNAYNSKYEPIRDNNQAVSLYDCYCENFVWRIDFSYNYIRVRYIGGNPNNSVDSPTYDVYPGSSNDGTITVDDRGTTMSDKTLETLLAIVDNIKSDNSNNNPIRNIDVNYHQE